MLLTKVRNEQRTNIGMSKGVLHYESICMYLKLVFLYAKFCIEQIVQSLDTHTTSFNTEWVEAGYSVLGIDRRVSSIRPGARQLSLVSDPGRWGLPSGRLI
jgi:hypothetical protein